METRKGQTYTFQTTEQGACSFQLNSESRALWRGPSPCTERSRFSNTRVLGEGGSPAPPWAWPQRLRGGFEPGPGRSAPRGEPRSPKLPPPPRNSLSSREGRRLGLESFPKRRLNVISLCSSSYKEPGSMPAAQMALVSMNFDSHILANHRRGPSLGCKGLGAPQTNLEARPRLEKHFHQKVQVSEKLKYPNAFKSSFSLRPNILALFYLKDSNFDVPFV